MAVGGKVIDGITKAYRIGKKIYNFFSGKRLGGKTTEAQDKHADATSLSNEDFSPKIDEPVAEAPPSPKLTRRERKDKKREAKVADAMTPRALPKAKGLQKVRSGVEALKEGLKVKQSGTENLASARAEAQRLRNIAEAPSKREFEKTAKHNRKVQKRFLKEAEKRKKKELKAQKKLAKKLRKL